MPHYPRRHDSTYRPSYDDLRSPTLTKDSYKSGDQDSSPAHIYRSSAPPATTDHDVFGNDTDKLFKRAISAYELVRSYRRDCVGGTRWSRGAVDEVRKFGINLHEHVNAVQSHQREYNKSKRWDEIEMQYIRDEVEKVRQYCEEVLALISDLERIPLRQRMSRSNAGLGVRVRKQEQDQE